MGWWHAAVLAIAALGRGPELASAALPALEQASWIDGKSAGVQLVDMSPVPAVTVAPGQLATFPLERPLTFRGALYDTLLVGPAPGEAKLTWRGRAAAGDNADGGTASSPAVLPGVPVATAARVRTGDQRHGAALPRSPSCGLGRAEPGVGQPSDMANSLAVDLGASSAGDVGGNSEAPELVLRPLGTALSPGPAAVTQVRLDPAEGAAVRWVGLLDPFGQAATFEVLVLGDGEIRYQYLQVPRSMRSNPDRAGVTLQDTGRPDGLVEPSRGGFRAVPGSVVSFPGDVPFSPLTGCGIATPWCTYATSTDMNCESQAGSGTFTSCATTEAKRWHFNEGRYCRSCPYTFYVTVECGTEMHLPFKDMEGNQVQITDVFTGTELELEGINQCARSFFQYCNNCPGAGITPDFTGTSCPGSPKIDCVPYVQHSTLIQWGFPFQDRDMDGVAGELPCGPSNNTGCGGSGAYPGFEQQSTDVVLHGSPALCGVFRLDIVSGGFDWYLSANCNGIVPDDPAEIESNFNVYQNCSDALAAFDPVPELVITHLDFSGVCPDITIDLEVTNVGCTDTQLSPVQLQFGDPRQPDILTNLGPVPAGTAIATSIPVRLNATPLGLTAVLDPSDVLAECTEQPAGSFSGCQPTGGSDRASVTLCLCTNTVHADVVSDRVYSCDRSQAVLDATPSTAVPCSGGRLEYEYLDAGGGVVRAWGTDPTYRVTPPWCPALLEFTVNARCSTEQLPECLRSRPLTVECVPAEALSVSAEPTTVCWGDKVTLEAGPGFVSYVWDHGPTGRQIEEYPVGDTTYRVTGIDRFGCTSTAQTTISVLPDPIPGPMGAFLRARKDGGDVAFSYRELPVQVKDYQLLLHQASGSTSPCAVFLPPGHPDPITMQAAATVDTALPGDAQPALRHVGGLTACPALLFYVVIGTSPCTGTRGASCDGFPMQWLPCP